MADSPGSSEPQSRRLALLTPDLAGRAQSAHDLAFVLEDAELAIQQFAAAGKRITAWDCWVLWPSGARARSLAHSGSFALPLDIDRAAEAAAAGMRLVQASWNRSPEYVGTTVYFTIELDD